MFKQAIKSLIPEKYTYELLHLRKILSFRHFWTHTFSGDGEDIVLGNIFFKQSSGLYVDVGAFHPKYLSNTYLLHKKGWSGINIDPNKDTIKKFSKYRPNDINLQIGISNENKKLLYYNFIYSGANTFEIDHANKKKEIDGNKLLSTEQISCFTLASVLQQHAANKTIDVLDIDVEGLDFEVLESNDWVKFSPTVVLIEDREFRVKLDKSKIYQFLKNRGYDFHSYNNITLIMKKISIS